MGMKTKTVAKAMTKSAIAAALATQHELKQKTAAKVMESIAELAAAEVGKTGKFVLPGLVMIKTRTKPATKAGKREIFGKLCVVKAKPARTIVKAFPVAALKKSV